MIATFVFFHLQCDQELGIYNKNYIKYSDKYFENIIIIIPFVIFKNIFNFFQMIVVFIIKIKTFVVKQFALLQ